MNHNSYDGGSITAKDIEKLKNMMKGDRPNAIIDRFNTPVFILRDDGPHIKNKALLDDGRIVDYDQCCDEGNEIKFGTGVKSFEFLGTGVIYEVRGVKQTLDREENSPYPLYRYKFYRVEYI